jgi:dTMP kinase
LPDVTILFELPEEDAAARLAARDRGGSDKIGGRTADYHASVVAAFARFADAERGRFCRIDASGTADAVHARVLAAIEPLMHPAVA